jgi:uncharacterized protein (DUF1501 family)
MKPFSTARRRFLQTLAAGALLPVVPGLSLGAALSSQANRFVLVVLRGAMDGLAAVQPYGDPSLAALREPLLVPVPELLKLDGFFGLHPALPRLHAMYTQRELEVFHAVATPYRERSHFDGQNVLETGLAQPDPGANGWLNALVAQVQAGEPAAMALGSMMPKVLQGAYPVGSWSPAVMPPLADATLARLQRLYQQDAFLGAQLEQALLAVALLDGQTMADGQRSPAFVQLADAAARFLSQEHGPVIAVLEMGGWDTHANQGAAQGTLAQRLTELDQGLEQLRTGMGSRWSNTQILVVTEFGRTAAVNGTGGTDHGTASVAFRLGGAGQGGLVVADWPGLQAGQLHDGRDLRPTRDLRTLYDDAALHLSGKPLGS